MLNIAVCDDSNIMLKSISEKINNILSCNIFEFCNGLDLLHSDIEFDIVFLDIAMPEINGFDLALKIKSKKPDVVIIFITSCQEKVFEGYKYGAFRFILKERINEDLAEALENGVKALENRSTMLEFKTKNREGTSGILIDSRDIIYIEKVLRKFTLYMADGEYIIVASSINDILERLNDSFVVVHRSYIVNMEKIKRIENMDIIMVNNAVINIGSKRIQLEKFKKKYFNFMRG